MAPPGECLPTTEIFRRLARRMGLDEPALYDSDETMARQLLDSGHPSLAGITLEALKARGSIRLNYPDPFVAVRDGVSDRVGQAGVRLRADGAGGTRSGRRLHARAYEPSQQDTPLAREYPLALVTPADHYFLNSIFANVAKQQRRSGAATLLIHPDDAAPRRIAAGDEVRVANARGAFLAVAERDRSRSPRRGRQHQGPLARIAEGANGQRHRGRARLGHGRRRRVPRQPRPRRACTVSVVAVGRGIDADCRDDRRSQAWDRVADVAEAIANKAEQPR